jgi:hypothetical protein
MRRLARLFPLALVCAALSAQVRTPYVETFDDGPGGWVANRYHRLTIFDGAAQLFGPWYLDSHHAPPGAGYLHMLMYLHTDQKRTNEKIGGPNRFTRGNRSRDLRNARFTLRLRGDIDLQGSQMVLLAQSQTSKTTANFVLTGQPFQIAPEWREQTIVLTPDPAQWTCLGARESKKHQYGCDDIETVLKDVNVDLILVLFPLNVVPVKPVAEPHKLRAGQDYPDEPSYEVWQKHLPKGLIQVDTVKIEYPQSQR